MRVKFEELIYWFKRGLRSGIFIAYNLQILVMEWYINAGITVEVEYEDGLVKEIKSIDELKDLLREIRKQVEQDKELMEILNKEV
jgi:hypothetical protein